MNGNGDHDELELKLYEELYDKGDINTIFHFISYEMIWNLNYTWDSNTTLPPM